MWTACFGRGHPQHFFTGLEVPSMLADCHEHLLATANWRRSVGEVWLAAGSAMAPNT